MRYRTAIVFRITHLLVILSIYSFFHRAGLAQESHRVTLEESKRSSVWLSALAIDLKSKKRRSIEAGTSIADTECLAFQIRSDIRTFAYLFEVNPRGKVVLHFPKDDSENERTDPRIPRFIPASSCIVVEKDDSMESRLYVIASLFQLDSNRLRGWINNHALLPSRETLRGSRLTRQKEHVTEIVPEFELPPLRGMPAACNSPLAELDTEGLAVLCMSFWYSPPVHQPNSADNLHGQLKPNEMKQTPNNKQTGP